MQYPYIDLKIEESRFENTFWISFRKGLLEWMKVNGWISYLILKKNQLCYMYIQPPTSLLVPS